LTSDKNHGISAWTRDNTDGIEGGNHVILELVSGCDKVIKPLIKGMKWLLLAASLLVLLAGFQLYVLTDFTDLYFAWTIQPPLTAAFLGGGYFASFLMEILASRKVKWGEGRIAVPAVFTFTTLTIIATLLHLDRFHFGSAAVFAQAAAWLWLAIYAIVPPVMLVMWIRQQLVSGQDPQRTAPLPGVLRVVLAAQGAIMMGWGVGLFAIPAVFAFSWPWKLTPLTSQAIGAWMVGIGVFAAHSVVENDYARIKVGLISYLAFGALETIAVLRYAENYVWTSLGAFPFAVLICSVLLVGVYSTVAAARSTKAGR
jgi:hypothetical protein